MWKDFKDFFIGNLNAYSVQLESGTWTVLKEKLNKNIIEKHLSKQITIGSYNIYKRHNVECCKWICLDIDSHPIDMVWILDKKKKPIRIKNSKHIKKLPLPLTLWDSYKKKPKKTVFSSKEQLEEYYWQKSGIIISELVSVNGKRIIKEKYRIEYGDYIKLERLSKFIFEFLIEFYNISRNNICREHSGRGYHIWIKLRDKTTLKRAWDFREDIKNKIYDFFGYECELFPKQRSLEGLTKSLGNFVKLPLSINRNNNKICRILDGFKLDKQNSGMEISDKVKRLRAQLRIAKKSESPKRKESMDLNKWKPLPNLEHNEFYKQLRPCLKEVVRGKPAVGTHGHYIRMQLANELFKLRAPLDARILAFKNQPDFNPEITRYQVLDLEMRARKNNKFFTANCETIAKKSYCLGDRCPFFYKAKIKDSEIQTDFQFEQNLDFGVKGGWVEVKKIIREILNKDVKTKEYIIKTTRSGATTNIILETLDNNKKILVIAPTIKICEITVKNAISLSIRDDIKLFRFGSNTDLCKTLFDKTERVPNLKRFPFLLKDNCKYCDYAEILSCSKHKRFYSDCHRCEKVNKERDKCNWRIAIEDIGDFDVIYITTAKLHALTKTKDPDAKKILKNIFKTIDVIFLDEVSEVLDVGNEGILFYAEPDNMYNLLSPKVNFRKRFNDEYEMVRDFIEARLNVQKRKVWFALFDFVKSIWHIHTHWKNIQKNNKFLRLDSPLYKVLQDLNKWYLDKQRIGSGDRDWLFIYKTIIEYTEQTDYYPDTIIKILIIAKFPQFYIQYTNPVRYRIQMEILPAKPIREFLDFINSISSQKQFFTTDATEPPIPIRKLFPNITELIINDPMDTARLQSVYPDNFSVNLSRKWYIESHINDMYDFINQHGNANTMIIAQNIFMSRRLRKKLKKGKHYRHLTYFRSPSTIGTPSACRNVITVGSPYPPKNSHRWLADLFIKEKLVDENDINKLTRHLEYYNAKSSFFQAISRGKDPLGETKSSVHCYGLDEYQVRQLLKFPIAIPKVEKPQYKIKISTESVE